MSERVLDEKGRWRNKIVAFRMSQEESVLLDEFVSLSGMSKQEYLIDKVLQKDLIVKPSPYLFKCLSKQLQQFIVLLEKQELKEWNSDEKANMCYMLKVIASLKEDNLHAYDNDVLLY